MPNGRIRRDAGESVGASALQSHTQLGERCRCALCLVRFDQSEKCLSNPLRHHCSFRTAALLLEDEQRLVKLWIALANFFTQNPDLRVLAAQTKNGSSGDVGMMNITCDQPA